MKHTEEQLTLTYTNTDKVEQSIQSPISDVQREKGIRVGRVANENDINLDCGSLSRKHCRFEIDENGNFLITDIGSTNGTFINKKKLDRGVPSIVLSSDSVSLADLPIKVTLPQSIKRPEHHPQLDDTEIQYGPDQTIVIPGKVHYEKSVLEDDDQKAAQGKPVWIDQNEIIRKIYSFGFEKPIISLLIVTLLTVAAGYALRFLEVDTSYNSMFSKKDPSYPPYLDVVKEFGSDNITIIYLKDNNIFTEERLALIESLTYQIEDLKYVEKSESLFTVLNIRDENGSLNLNPIIDILPETEEEIATVKDNALYSPLLKREFISEDGNVTAISVTIKNIEDDPDYNRRVFKELEALMAPLREHFDAVFQIGPPRLNAEIQSGMIHDLSTITVLVAIVILCSIALFLKTGMAALIPFVTAGLSIIWTGGFMGATGIPVNLLTSILPALILVIGSTEDTHMLAAYIQGFHKKLATKYTAVRFMATHVGIPVFLTSFTTTVGFLSNILSDIGLIRDFGIVLAFGMTANLIVTILVLPVLLKIYTPKVNNEASGRDTKKNNTITNKTLNFIEMLSEKYEKRLLIITIGILVVLCFFIFRINVSNDPLSYFKQSNDIITHSNLLHDDLAGMQVFYLTVHAEDGKDFKDPDQLQKIEALQKLIVETNKFDKVMSIVDYITLVHQEMNLGDKELYKVPDSRDLIEQYLLMFQRTDVERYLSPDHKRINMVIRHNISDSWKLNECLTEVSDISDDQLREMHHFLSGKNLLINKAADTLFTSQVSSLALVISIIFIIMSLLFSSVIAGIFSLVPNLIPIIVLFGTMGLFGIPLNPGTATVAVIAIGIAIDDTIHLLTRYNHECRINPDQKEATKATVRAEALPVISTSISLAVGFTILLTSSFNILAQFGILSALTLIVAMTTDLLITPIFLKRLRLVGVWEFVSSTFQKEEVLIKSPLFKEMSRFQIRKAIILSEIKEYNAGDIIYNQGDEGNELYLVLSGTAEILHFEHQKKRLVAQLECGNIFGEAGYAGSVKRPNMVRASRQSALQLLTLNADKLESAIKFYPWIKLKLAKNISHILATRV